MLQPERYFDHAATTPVDPRVREAMLPYFGENFGNASSLHQLGRQAAAAIDKAAEQLASLLQVDPQQLYFTSGATESNNWVLNAADEIIISPFEHSAMREPAIRKDCQFLDNQGPDLHPATTSTSTLLSVMSDNNETGMRWDVRELTSSAPKLHSDATQSVGKLPLALEELDYASLSAHKFYGPKGVGALYCRDFPPEPLILGGEQQDNARGGTLNVPGIVGMGMAAEIANERMEQDFAHVSNLKQILKQETSNIPDLLWNENPAESQSPYICSLSLLDLEGETLVIELDRAGFAVSSGAACSAGSTEPSHVLTALGLEPEWLRGTIRVSFGRANTKEATRHLGEEITKIAQKLRKI